MGFFQSLFDILRESTALRSEKEWDNFRHFRNLFQCCRLS